MDIIFNITESMLLLANSISFYILLGLLIAVVLMKLIPDGFISSHLGNNKTLNHWIFHIMIKPNNYLFGGDDKVFKSAIQNVDYYGEYGVGKSTIWVYANTKVKKILAVDTSKEWATNIQRYVNDTNRLIVEWVDLGNIGRWGKPKDYSKRENILNYVKSIWEYKEKPELILIDGRFRVACFLYSLAHGKEGVQIIFDDYTNRPHYHLVEEFVKPIETCGRQCLFVVPKKVNKEKIINLMHKFLFVME